MSRAHDGIVQMVEPCLNNDMEYRAYEVGVGDTFYIPASNVDYHKPKIGTNLTFNSSTFMFIPLILTSYQKIAGTYIIEKIDIVTNKKKWWEFRIPRKVIWGYTLRRTS